MDYTLQTKDPMVLVKGMDSYFKDIPPDQGNLLRGIDNKTVRRYHTCQKFKNMQRAIYIPNFALK